jgi:hypothetical protein
MLIVKPSLRTKSIGTKVREEEYAQLKRVAQAEGKTVGEWCRGVMLSTANRRPPKATEVEGDGHALMAELVALRAILLNVLFKQAKGEPVTAEEMQRLIDRADSDKLRKARERLEQASGSKES